MATVVTVPPVPTRTNPLNSQPPRPSTTQSSHAIGLNTIQIVVIVVGSILALGLVIIWYLLIARARRRRQTLPPSRTLGATEKCGDLEYTPFEFPTHNQTFRDHGGTAPLLNIPIHNDRMSSQQSYISSQNHNETRYFLFDDGPPSSLFTGISGEDEITQVPLSHAISFADATPYMKPEESHLDSVTLLPPLARSISPKHLPPLPPLIIPEDIALPTRRSSRRKQPRRGSSYDSDDSASLYSQASASTRIHIAPKRSLSVDYDLPLLAEPLTPHPKSTSDFRPPPFQQIPSSPEIPPLPIVLLPEEDAEEKQMTRENTVLVAKLLKSRTKHTTGEPWRNSSIVSHIERSGSIRPVLGNEEDEPRGTRHLRKLRGRRMNKPVLSSTAMAESIALELEGMELEGAEVEGTEVERRAQPGTSSS